MPQVLKKRMLKKRTSKKRKTLKKMQQVNKTTALATLVYITPDATDDEEEEDFKEDATGK